MKKIIVLFLLFASSSMKLRAFMIKSKPICAGVNCPGNPRNNQSNPREMQKKEEQATAQKKLSTTNENWVTTVTFKSSDDLMSINKQGLVLDSGDKVVFNLSEKFSIKFLKPATSHSSSSFTKEVPSYFKKEDNGFVYTVNKNAAKNVGLTEIRIETSDKKFFIVKVKFEENFLNTVFKNHSFTAKDLQEQGHSSKTETK